MKMLMVWGWITKMVEEIKKIPVFIIDDSVLKDMFEGKNQGKSDDLLKKLKKSNDEQKDFGAFTTSSSFFRAIFLSDPELKIVNIQKILSFVTITPSFADPKDGKAVTKELLILANKISRGPRQ